MKCYLLESTNGLIFISVVVIVLMSVIESQRMVEVTFRSSSPYLPFRFAVLQSTYHKAPKLAVVSAQFSVELSLSWSFVENWHPDASRKESPANSQTKYVTQQF